jgi:sulfite exporter TauE/SafE/copper chaperone CopZ
MKKYTLYVSGTHCASCKIIIEDTLNEQEGVVSASVNLQSETVAVETNKEVTAQELATTLTQAIKEHGYSLSVEKDTKEREPIIWKAIPIGMLFLALFFVLQKSGILNFGIGGQVTPVTSFLIGLVASVSSCLAIVGGLVLSLSAKVTQEDSSNKKPLVLFHVGRIVSFAVLGGLLGVLGQAVGVNFILSSVLGIVASVIMLTLGLTLMGVFRKSKFTLPSEIFSFFRKMEHTTFTPLLIGVGTFFLPCGFTQSMQVASLASGSFVSGMLIMFFFALGTLPVLALLSVSAVSFAKSKHAPLFFASVGVVVTGLGLFALLAGLAGLGIINPLFTF